MKLFGLISLVAVIVIGAWITAQSTGLLKGSDSSAPDEQEQTDSIIDSARTAAEQLGSVVPATNRVVIYDNISVPEDATVVDLSGRQLTGSLKAEIRLLTDLVTLDVSDNNFTGVPAEIGQLTNLEIVDLSGNPITGLPLEIGNLKKLKMLNLKGTNYSEYDLSLIKKELPETTLIITD